MDFSIFRDLKKSYTNKAFPSLPCSRSIIVWCVLQRSEADGSCTSCQSRETIKNISHSLLLTITAETDTTQPATVCVPLFTTPNKACCQMRQFYLEYLMNSRKTQTFFFSRLIYVYSISILIHIIIMYKKLKTKYLFAFIFKSTREISYALKKEIIKNNNNF